MNELICCVYGRPEHFVQDAKYLSCGHPICSGCIRFLKDLSGNENDDGLYNLECEMVAAKAIDDSFDGYNIKCSNCNEPNKLDLRLCPVVKLVESYLEKNINEFAEELFSKMKSVEDQVNSESKVFFN
jgi:hypothetical protein